MKTLLTVIISLWVTFPMPTEYDLERKTVVDNELSILIPKRFKHIRKENYIPSYEGEPKPEDYFTNDDKTIQIGFLKHPKQSDDLSWVKQFMSSSFIGNDPTFYFNEIITVNDMKIHLAEFDGTFEGKKQFLKMFIINGKSSILIGNISCDIELKEKWETTADKILRSIELK